MLLLLHIKRNDVFCEAFLVPSIGKLDVTFHTYLIFFADVFVYFSSRWRAVAVTITGKFFVAFVFLGNDDFFFGFCCAVYLSWLISRCESVCVCNKEWIGSEMNGKIIMIENLCESIEIFNMVNIWVFHYCRKIWHPLLTHTQ